MHPPYTHNLFVRNPDLNSFDTKLTFTFISTFAALFCLPCEPHSPDQIKKNKIVCNEYGRRLYLRPIMPPMTRRQSRREGMESVRVGDGGERSIDEVEVKEQKVIEKPVKEDGVALAPQASSDSTRAPGNIEVTDPASEPSSSTQHSKSRTFSMEMTDALEALHRKEEGEEEALDIVEEHGESESSTSDSDTGPLVPKNEIKNAPLSAPTNQPPALPNNTNRLEVIAALGGVLERPWVMEYDCAAGCLEPVVIRQGEPMRCRQCASWMLWKRRTKRICYFEAR